MTSHLIPLQFAHCNIHQFFSFRKNEEAVPALFNKQIVIVICMFAFCCCCLLMEHIEVSLNSLKHVHVVQIELEFGSVGF